MDAVKEFIEKIRSKAEPLHFNPVVHEEPLVTTAILHDIHGGDIKLQCDFPHGEDVVVPIVFIRTSSWVYNGERTDLHDCISQLFGGFLRCTEPNISVALWDYPNPVAYIEGELYARWLVIEQPFRMSLALSEESLDTLVMFLVRIRAFWECIMMCGGVTTDANGEPVLSSDWRGCLPWARRMARIQGERLRDPGVQFNRRKTLTWNYYRSERKGVSLIWSPPFCAGLHEYFKLLLDKHPRAFDSTNGKLISSTNGVANVIHAKDERRIKRLFSALNARHKQSYILVPLENSIVAFGRHHTLFVSTDCSRKAFEIEREKLLERHRRESNLLFPTVEFEWQERIDDEEFELLVRDMLNREPGMHRVRKAGHSRERDRGRDLLAEWVTTPRRQHEVDDLRTVRIPRSVVVQCKATSKKLGKGEVIDIRDTIEEHKADGFMVVTSSFLTGALVNHLELMRSEHRYFIDWWTRNEMEDRLKFYPDLVRRYKGVFVTKRTISPPTPASTPRSLRKSG
jgi:hypothetical protein